jgi:plasmid stabilization system protein ParE
MPAELRWHPAAVGDLQSAASWYRSQDDGALLAARFERAMARELEHVARAPERWPVIRQQYRQKVFASPFPYVLIYRIAAGVVIVIAVAHQRRRPGHWADR